MKKNCYIKKLTSAEVGATKAHVGGYIRLPNDFDFTAFFQQKGQDNNGVIEIIFDAINCNNGKRERNLRFAYFKNSNQEKRIPNLATLFNENGVSAGDVIKLESCQNKGSVEFFIHFYKNSNIQTTATNVYYVYSDDGNETAIAISKNLPLQQIFYGAPGTGKSFKIKECTKGDDTVIRTTFHPDSDYSTFVGCYKPTMINKEPLYKVGELINKLSKIKTSGVTYPCHKFAAKYWESLKNLSSSDINYILTACGFTASMNVEVSKGIAVGEYFSEQSGNKKIVYSFVAQAFTKAYIQAWKKMVDYHPKYRTFYVGSTKYDIIGISGDLVRVKVSDSEDSEELEIRKSELEDIFKTKDSHDVEQNHDNDEEQNRNKELWNNPNELGLNNPNEIKPDPSDIDKIKERIGERLKGIDKSFDDAWKILEKDFLNPQFLIIEEINRGNCAQIFGDLFQLLDRKEGYSEYPIEADDDLRKELEIEFAGLKLGDGIKKKINDIFKENYPDGITDKILNGELLVLPENLYIWATMNTSDQSLFPIDSAFKRRWDWEYQPIVNAHKDWQIMIEGYKPIDWWAFVERINYVVADLTKSEDKQLGYFFCMPDKKANEYDKEATIISANRFVQKVIFYLWNDVFKDYSYEPTCCNKNDKADKLMYADFYKKTNGKEIDTDALVQFLKQLNELCTNFKSAGFIEDLKEKDSAQTENEINDGNAGIGEQSSSQEDDQQQE